MIIVSRKKGIDSEMPGLQIIIIKEAKWRIIHCNIFLIIFSNEFQITVVISHS